MKKRINLSVNKSFYAVLIISILLLTFMFLFNQFSATGKTVLNNEGAQNSNGGNGERVITNTEEGKVMAIAVDELIKNSNMVELSDVPPAKASESYANGYNSITRRNADGTYTTELYSRDMFFFDGENFVPLSNISEPRLTKKEITLNKIPDSSLFDFGTYALHKGISAQVENNELIIKDAKNKTLKILPQPYATDANNVVETGSYALRFAKLEDTNEGTNESIMSLGVELSQDWLNGAKYPVVVDPTVNLSNNTGIYDSFVTYPSDTLLREIFGDYAISLQVGRHRLIINQNPRRAFMEFNTSSIPDSATIGNVVLNLSIFAQVYDVGDTVNLTRFNLTMINNLSRYPDTKAGNENLFNDGGGGSESVIGGGFYLTGLTDFQNTGNKSFDLGTTADNDLQVQLDGDYFGVGFIGTDESTDDNYVTISSSETNLTSLGDVRPKLFVTYSSCSPPGAGDWECTDPCSFHNDELLVPSNLYVYSGCVLNFTGRTNVTFVAPSSYIYVYSGGQILLNDTAGVNKVK